MELFARQYCVLFRSKVGAGVENQTLGALCAVKFQKWKNALERFVDHESSKYHRNSVLTAETITAVLSEKQDSIAIQLDHLKENTNFRKPKKDYPHCRNNYPFWSTGNPFPRISRLLST